TRHPILGYLTTVAIDHFDFLNQRRADGTPLTSAFAPQAAARRPLGRRLPEVLDFLESLYGPYPFESGGGIYVDTKLNFSLETHGAGKEFTAVYYRGPLFLHALRRTIGDDAFFPAVSQFVQSHAYARASMPEFRRFIQSKTSKGLSGFFAAWLDTTTPPPVQ